MKNNNKHKNYLIKYIKQHSRICCELPLETFRIEALVIIKVQLELDLQNEISAKKCEMIGLV
ncbi:MAG: hypothetical protein Q8M29_00805 [Bacteroidota bacterium]|nr:hypothetical protein [Bacteroidota bacterium]